MRYTINGREVDQGEFSRSTENGIHRKFYKNNSIKEELEFINGDGTCIKERNYHSNGQMRSECSYDPSTGDTIGIQRGWDKKGNLTDFIVWTNEEDDEYYTLEGALRVWGRLGLLVRHGFNADEDLYKLYEEKWKIEEAIKTRKKQIGWDKVPECGEEEYF